MAETVSLKHALEMFHYYADDALLGGAPKNKVELEKIQAKVLERLPVAAGHQLYLGNLVADYVMRKTATIFPGVPRFHLLSGALGGRFHWDLLYEARSDVLRGLKKSWDVDIEIKDKKKMDDGKAYREWNSWTSPNPHSGASLEAFSRRIEAERDVEYRGTPMGEDLAPWGRGLAEMTGVEKLVDDAKEFPFFSGLPSLMMQLVRQGMNRGVILERARLAREEPERGISASALKVVPFSKEIDAVLELLEGRFDFDARLFKEPSSRSKSHFEHAVLEAKERLAEEPVLKGRGAKKIADRRLLVASLLVLGERLATGIMRVSLDPPKKPTDVVALVTSRVSA